MGRGWPVIVTFFIYTLKLVYMQMFDAIEQCAYKIDGITSKPPSTTLTQKLNCFLKIRA